MKLQQQLISFFLLITAHVVALLAASGLLLFAENGDQVFVLLMGTANALFLKFRVKLNIYTAFIFGFFNTALSISLVYLLMYFNMDTGKAIPYFLCTLGISWVYLQTNWEKFNLKKINAIMALPVIVMTWSSFQIKKYYQPKTEKENLTTVEFTIQNTAQKTCKGDSIEVRIQRNPFFGLKETHSIAKKALDKNGKCAFILSKNHDYKIAVAFSDNGYSFEEITSQDLKSKNKFTITK